LSYSKLFHHRSTDRCLGAYALDKKTGEVHTFLADYTVLATGGCGKVYLITSNPDIATGDGIAMAWRCGATIGNMEFIQFHPTCLYHPYARNFLITEAVRGEGGVLRNAKGERFMDEIHPMGALAPRDVVARAIDHEIKRTGADCVYLDISHLGQKAAKKFPNIHSKCLSLGIDITREPIPVAPAAHYLCGGVRTDINGETTIPNLFAIGEVAYTGLHGANRLASTSLLECLVWGKRAAENILKTINKEKIINHQLIKPWKYTHTINKIDDALIQQDWFLIKSIMWNYVGIIRTEKRLKRAVDDLTHLDKEIDFFYRDVLVCDDLIGLRNGVKAALLIAKAALKNKTSLGCHYLKSP